MACFQGVQDYNFEEEEKAYLYYADEVLTLEEGEIPAAWKDAMSKTGCEDRINKVLDMWKAVLPEELSEAIAYMEDNLDDVELVGMNGKFYLLYSVYTRAGDIIYYVGGNPMDSDLEELDAYECNSRNLKKVRVFYEKLHNGFYNYNLHAMGLVETENVTCLGDKYWEVLEELENPLQVNLETTYGFYDNGADGYLAIDLESDKCVVWYNDEQPRYNTVFWKMIDMLFVMCLQNTSYDEENGANLYENQEVNDYEADYEDDDDDDEEDEEEFDEEDLIADRREPDWSFDYDEWERKYAKSVGPVHAKEMIELRKQADALYTEDGILYMKDLDKFNELLAESQRIGFQYYRMPEAPAEEDISKYEKYMISDEEMEEILSRMKAKRDYGMMQSLYEQSVGKQKGEICLRLFKKADSLLEEDFSVTDANKPEWERILKQIDEILDGK